MTPQYLMFAVGLVAIATVAVAAMELAILSKIQQDADGSTRGCKNSIAVNASLGKCLKEDKPHPEAAESAESDESDDKEEEDDE